MCQISQKTQELKFGIYKIPKTFAHLPIIQKLLSFEKLATWEGAFNFPALCRLFCLPQKVSPITI